MFYCADTAGTAGRPALLATALLLLSHDKVSDAEAKAPAEFDIRWKVTLGIEMGNRPFPNRATQVEEYLVGRAVDSVDRRPHRHPQRP